MQFWIINFYQKTENFIFLRLITKKSQIFNEKKSSHEKMSASLLIIHFLIKKICHILQAKLYFKLFIFFWLFFTTSQ